MRCQSSEVKSCIIVKGGRRLTLRSNLGSPINPMCMFLVSVWKEIHRVNMQTQHMKHKSENQTQPSGYDVNHWTTNTVLPYTVFWLIYSIEMNWLLYYNYGWARVSHFKIILTWLINMSYICQLALTLYRTYWSIYCSDKGVWCLKSKDKYCWIHRLHVIKWPYFWLKREEKTEPQ